MLKVLGAGTMLAGFGCSGNKGEPEPTGVIAGGNIASLTIGELKKLDGQRVLLGRDTKGVYAMTAICTHEQCDMSGGDGSVQTDGIVCSCHGSKFDTNGARISGPANAPLAHLVVTIDATGAISINASQTVDAAMRTPISTA